MVRIRPLRIPIFKFGLFPLPPLQTGDCGTTTGGSSNCSSTNISTAATIAQGGTSTRADSSSSNSGGGIPGMSNAAIFRGRTFVSLL